MFFPRCSKGTTRALEAPDQGLGTYETSAKIQNRPLEALACRRPRWVVATGVRGPERRDPGRAPYFLIPASQAPPQPAFPAGVRPTHAKIGRERPNEFQRTKAVADQKPT